jgi:hypothetical protein
MSTIIEPFRIKTVEPLRFTTRDERRRRGGEGDREVAARLPDRERAESAAALHRALRAPGDRRHAVRPASGRPLRRLGFSRERAGKMPA